MKKASNHINYIVVLVVLSLLGPGTSSAWDVWSLEDEWPIFYSYDSPDEDEEDPNVAYATTCTVRDRDYSAGNTYVWASVAARVTTELEIWMFGGGYASVNLNSMSAGYAEARWKWSGAPGTAPATTLSSSMNSSGYVWCSGWAYDSYAYGLATLHASSDGSGVTVANSNGSYTQASGTASGSVTGQSVMASGDFTVDGSGSITPSINWVSEGAYSLEGYIDVWLDDSYETSSGLSQIVAGAAVCVDAGSSGTVTVIGGPTGPIAAVRADSGADCRSEGEVTLSW